MALSEHDVDAFGRFVSSVEPRLRHSSTPAAFLGTGGAYGMVSGPLYDEPTRFLVRSWPRGTLEELDVDEEVVTGLTAAQIYQLDGYSAIPPVHELHIDL